MALSLKERFVNALFGTPVQVEGVAPSVSYGDKIDEYLNSLGSQPYMQGLLNQPKETALTLEQYKRGIANGLNYGVKEIADMQDKLGIRKPQTGDEIYEAGLGKFNQPNVLNIVTSNAPRQGGFLNDLASGFKENYAQGFNVDNLQPQNKGLTTRIGEGLGTLARFYNKPIGRMAVATGLSMLTDEANPLGEGVKAYVGRQTNMTRDKAYRQSLINMGVDEAQVNAIPGIMTDDIYKNLIDAKQAQEMQKYREMYLDTQNKNQEGLNKYRMLQIAQEAEQNNFKNMIDRQKLAIELKKLEKGDPVSINNIFALANHFDTLPEVKNFKEIDRQFANVNETYKAYKNGELKANAADQAMVTTLNKILDPTSVVRESEFARTAAGQSAFNRMQGYLDKLTKGGGGLTNREREDLFNTMKIMRNSAYNTYSNTAQTYTDMANRYGMNPDDIIRYKSSYTDNENNMQTVKMRNPKTGKIYNVPLQDVEEMQLKGGEIVNG